MQLTLITLTIVATQSALIICVIYLLIRKSRYSAERLRELRSRLDKFEPNLYGEPNTKLDAVLSKIDASNQEIIKLRNQSHTYHSSVMNRLGKETEDIYALLESLDRIRARINNEVDFGPLRKWAMYPDSVIEILEELEHKELIVEFGSGVSTIAIGSALKAQGRGKLISLEHDPSYLEVTRARLKRNGLEGVVELILAPLEVVEVGEEKFNWYSTEGLNIEIDSLDAIIVDGPPGDSGPLARFPAAVLMQRYLKNTGVVFLDDGEREDEEKIVDLWTSKYGYSAEYRKTLKGLYILRPTQ